MYSYVNKLGNLEEMDKFLETYNLLRLNQEETENLNRSILSNEIEAVIKTLWINKSPGSDHFTGDYYKTFKELICILKLFPKIEEEGKLQIFFKASITLMLKPEKDTMKKSITGQYPW